MRFCPFAHRSVLVLNAKNVPHDLVFVDLQQKPEWLFQFSPKGSVPALEYEQGKAIFDSIIIDNYLYDKYPAPALRSADPLRRAQDLIVLENFGQVLSVYYTAAFSKADLTPKMVKDFNDGLEALQKELDTRGTKFLNGDHPGLVDYTMWPFLERFEALPLINRAELAIDKSKFKALVAYIEAMKQFPAVKSYLLDAETHAKFLESSLKGDPNYDMLENSSPACGFRPKKKQ